jgi:hypothetical protein
MSSSEFEFEGLRPDGVFSTHDEGLQFSGRVIPPTARKAAAINSGNKKTFHL